MAHKAFAPEVVLRLGPVEVTSTVVYSLIVSGVLIALALLVRYGLRRGRSGWPTAAEFIVEHLEGIMRDMFRRDPRPFTPLVVTLALFIATANLLGLGRF
jgi:F0F1-type ATP synthase membrane subunit a